MTFDDSILLLKALSDPSRLRMVRALGEGERTSEGLATRLGLAASTVSFHLDRLEAAGVVTRRREQYYTTVSVHPQRLALTLADLIGARDENLAREMRREEKAEAAVLKTFFHRGRLVALPVQKKKRAMVLDRIVRLFAPEVEYREAQVDERIHDVYEDHCLIRRLLVDEGYMTRHEGRYRRIDISSSPHTRTTEMTTPSTQDWKKTAKREYKERPLQAGIFTITNLSTGKTYLGSSLNMHGPLNKHRLMLVTGGHINAALQKDWNEFGEQAFRFQVEELVKVTDDPDFDRKDALAALEREWISRYQPFAERCYNRNDKIREA